MKKLKYCFVLVLFCSANHAAFSQGSVSACPQPKCLLDPTQDVEINQIISANRECGDTAAPWVVYSTQQNDFGDKYYVVKNETLDKFHIYSGSGTSRLKINNQMDKGMRPKADFLFRFAAEFTAAAHIHKKCVVLNSQGLIDSICMGAIDESQIPVYTDPVANTLKKHTNEAGRSVPSYLPIYSIYFVYQHTKTRYLLGREYKFDPNRPFSEQIIGWVDKHRVFDYNNRLCFEPNFDNGPVRQRRCDTVYGNAKVFSSANELGVFIATPEIKILPLWEEPDSFYVKNPRRFVSGDTFNIGSLREKIRYGIKGATENLTNHERSPKFFRFPYLGITKNDSRVFQVAATGRYVRSKKSICEALKINKSKINVFFIIPDSLPDAYALFFLNQLNDKYANFDRSFAGCYYPQGAGNLNIIRAKDRLQSYQVLRDSVVSHVPDTNHRSYQDCYSLLDKALDEEPFNIKETNLIVLVNSRKSPDLQPNTGNSISLKMAEKNCYLLAIDFNGSTSFSTSVQAIAKGAAGMFKQMHRLPTVPIEWTLAGKQNVMTNYLLAVVSTIDTALLKGPQIMNHIQASIEPLHSTLDRVIKEECDMETDSVPLSESETVFKRGLESLNSDCARDLTSMRIMQMGYSRLTYDKGDSLLWKAEVLMTERELTDLITQMDGFTFSQSGGTLCNKICTLWQSLISRFIGQEMIVDNTYLDLTICQIINKMIGANFGYYCNEPIKRYTLRDICQGQQNVLDPADAYQKTVGIKLDLLKQKLSKEYFTSFSGMRNTTDIRYYWVPVNLLP